MPAGAVDEVDEWFVRAGDREGELRRVDELVMAAVPGIDRHLVPVGSGRMLGYGLMPYRPKSATETTMWPLIALAARSGISRSTWPPSWTASIWPRRGPTASAP